MHEDMAEVLRRALDRKCMPVWQFARRMGVAPETVARACHSRCSGLGSPRPLSHQSARERPACPLGCGATSARPSSGAAVARR